MRLRFRDVLAVPNMSSEEYHGKPYNSLSASRLKTLMESERKFELRHKLRRVSLEEKKHFVFGQILHHVVLESKRVDETNWSNSTVAMFESRNIPTTEPTVVKTDSIGNVVDSIWVVSSPVPGLFRASRRWGYLNGSHWRHEHDLIGLTDDELVELDDPEPVLCGFVAFQDMLFDGDGFRAIPNDVLGKGGSKSTKAFKDWKKQFRGQHVVDVDGDSGWWTMIRMRQELRMSDPARTLLFDYPEDSLYEYTLVGYDIDFGYEVRCRMDKARPHNRVLHITDLKTSRDASPKVWQNQCWRDWQPMQGWMMTQLGAAAFGMDVEYKYVVVGKDVDCRVEVFEMTEKSLEIGGEMYDEAVTRFHQCDRSGIWRPKTHGQIHRIDPPYWMMQDSKNKQALRGTGAEKFYD